MQRQKSVAANPVWFIFTCGSFVVIGYLLLLLQRQNSQREANNSRNEQHKLKSLKSEHRVARV